MANVKITDLPAVATLTGSDVLPIVDIDASTTKKATVQQIVDLVPTGSSTADLTSIVDAEGYFTSSNVEGALEQLGSGFYGVTGSVLSLHVNTTSGDDNNDGLTPATALKTVQKAVYTFKSPAQPPYWSGADVRYIHVTGNVAERVFVPVHRGPGVLVIQSADEVVAETGLTVSNPATWHETGITGSVCKVNFDFTGATLTANEYSGSAFVVPDSLAGSGIKDAVYETLPIITNGTNSFTVVGEKERQFSSYYWDNGTAFSVYQPTAIWTTDGDDSIPSAYYDESAMIANEGSNLIVKGFVLAPSGSNGSVIKNYSVGWDSRATIERCRMVMPSSGTWRLASGGNWILNAIVQDNSTGIFAVDYTRGGGLHNVFFDGVKIVTFNDFAGYIYLAYQNAAAGTGMRFRSCNMNDCLLEVTGSTGIPAIRFEDHTNARLYGVAAYTDDTDCAVLVQEGSYVQLEDARYFTGEARGANSVGLRVDSDSTFVVDDFWNPADMTLSGTAGKMRVGLETTSIVRDYASGSVISKTERNAKYILGVDHLWWGGSGTSYEGRQERGSFEKLWFAEGTGSATPANNFSAMYAKADGLPYWKTDGGVEYNLAATGSALAGGSDNTITRWDGTTNVQSSSVFIDDSGNIYPLTSSQTSGLNGKEWSKVWTKTIGNSSGSVFVENAMSVVGQLSPNSGMYVNGPSTFAGNIQPSNSTSRQLGVTGTPWYRFWVKETLFEEIAEPATPAATKGALYTSASVPGIFFKNSAGQVYNLTSGSGGPAGTGSVSGTGSANQMTFFESSSVITGSTLNTYNPATSEAIFSSSVFISPANNEGFTVGSPTNPGLLTARVNTGQIWIKKNGGAATPSLAIGDSLTALGLFAGTNTLGLVANGKDSIRIADGAVTVNNNQTDATIPFTVKTQGSSTAFRIVSSFDQVQLNVTGNAGLPALGFGSSDGFYKPGTNQLGVSLNGAERALFRTDLFRTSVNTQITGTLDVSSSTIGAGALVKKNGTIVDASPYSVGLDYNFDTAGGTTIKYGGLVTLNAGHAGTAATVGFATTNNLASTGYGNNSNIGFYGVAAGAASSSNIGVIGESYNNQEDNVGVLGLAGTATGDCINMGVVGMAYQVSNNKNVAGYFALRPDTNYNDALQSHLTIDGAALVADSGPQSGQHVFLGLTNGTRVFEIIDDSTSNGCDVVISGSLNLSGNIYFHTASANRSGIVRNSNNGDIEFFREGDRKFYMDEFYGIVMDDDIDASTNVNFDIGSISAGFRTFYIQNITAPSSENYIEVRKGLHITGSTYVTNDADPDIAVFKVDTSDESVHIGARDDNLARIPGTNFSISSGSYVDMKLVSYDNANANAPYFYMCRGSGSIDTPGFPDQDMLLGYLGFAGYNAGFFSPGANIQALADENWNGSAYGSRLVFSTVNNGATSATEKLRLDTNGVTASADTRILGELSVSGSAGSDMVTLSASANVDTDLSLGNVFELTLTSSCTLSNPTNLNAGYSYMWILKQDAGGGNTLSYGSSFKFPGGVTPTLSTGSNAVDVMSAVCDGTNLYCTVQTNFS